MKIPQLSSNFGETYGTYKERNNFYASNYGISFIAFIVNTIPCSKHNCNTFHWGGGDFDIDRLVKIYLLLI